MPGFRTSIEILSRGRHEIAAARGIEMKTLPKGANAPLASSGTLRVELHWPRAPAALDAVCFAVGDDGRIPSDDWFIFYNQRQSPGAVVDLATTLAGRAELRVQLERLPPGIQRLVIAAAMTDGAFRDLIGARLTVTPAAGEPLAFELTEAGDEQALIFAELYRHGAGWKLRAVGQGFRGGLQPLAEHFGVAVADDAAAPETSAPAPIEPPQNPPTPPRPIPLESAPPPTPEPRQRRARPSRLTWSLALMILLATATGALWLFKPDWLAIPGELWSEAHDRFAYTSNTSATLDAPRPPTPESAERDNSTASSSRFPARYQAPTCPWEDAQVFERYHALGENYVRILQRVERSNKLLGKWRNELRQQSASDCAAPFVEGNRQEVEQLSQLPIAAWMDESIKLNNCAGLLIKRLDKELNQESRPIIIQRLVRESDRARNLESDLTDIARDLAYLRNKTARLIDGFEENIEACGR
jgi:stress response protein SCP2